MQREGIYRRKMNKITSYINKFRVTPLQAGMLFHKLAEPGSGVDIEHVAVTVKEKLDIIRIKKSWAHAISNRDALRSSFDWSDANGPYQLVHQDFDIPLIELDWSNETSENVVRLKSKCLSLIHI